MKIRYDSSVSTLIENKKARLNYKLLETIEAGIELLGMEVKSLRKKQGSLTGAHIIIRGNEGYLVGMHIPPYQPNNTPDGYEPDRPRRLLLHKKEIAALIGTEKAKGLTILPIKVYTKGRHIKVTLAIARGKKKYDKRETIKKRDTERDIQRSLKKNIRL